jgi:hypothetical protein
MVAKARLVEIKWDTKQQQAQPVARGKRVEVQFNPQTLKLSFANENKGGEQPGGSSKHFVGSSTSKLSVELLFDTTEETAANKRDVRRKTEQVAYFIGAKSQDDRNNKRVPPGISFEWGSFIFRGVVDTMQETLEYFSEEGVPMRATVSLSISRHEIEFKFGTPERAVGGPPGTPPGTPGTAPLEPARPGDSVQRMAGRQGNSRDWKAIAAANNIDDPLRLSAGALLNMNAGISVGAAAGVGAGIGASAGIGAGAGLSAGGSVGFSAGLGAGVGFSATAGVSAGVGASAGAGISGSAGFSAEAGVSAGAGFGVGTGVSAGASAGVGAALSAGVGVSAGGGFGAGVDVVAE